MLWRVQCPAHTSSPLPTAYSLSLRASAADTATGAVSATLTQTWGRQQLCCGGCEAEANPIPEKPAVDERHGSQPDNVMTRETQWTWTGSVRLGCDAHHLPLMKAPRVWLHLRHPRHVENAPCAVVTPLGTPIPATRGI